MRNASFFFSQASPIRVIPSMALVVPPSGTLTDGRSDGGVTTVMALGLNLFGGKIAAGRVKGCVRLTMDAASDLDLEPAAVCQKPFPLLGRGF